MATDKDQGDDLDLGDEFAQEYGANVDKESEGTSMDVSDKPGWRIWLRSMHCNAWRNFMQERVKRHAKLFKRKLQVPVEKQDEDVIETLAMVGVVKWEGFNSIPCTPENVRKTMTRFPDFRQECLEWMADRANYRDQVKSAIAKNSETASELN